MQAPDYEISIKQITQMIKEARQRNAPSQIIDLMNIDLEIMETLYQNQQHIFPKPKNYQAQINRIQQIIQDMQKNNAPPTILEFHKNNLETIKLIAQQAITYQSMGQTMSQQTMLQQARTQQSMAQQEMVQHRN